MKVPDSKLGDPSSETQRPDTCAYTQKADTHHTGLIQHKTTRERLQ